MANDPPSVRLHGYPVSNWFNFVRAAMIEKGLGGDFVPARMARDPAFLANSAMGKIPWLETPHGGLAESVPILEYLEDIAPERPLLPPDPYERAKVRQIVNVVQLYIEAPMRELYPAVFMGGDREEAPVASSLDMVGRAFTALDQLCGFAPFARGNALTAADLALFYTLELGERVSRHMTGRSLFEGRPQLAEWDKMVRSRESTGIVLTDFASAFADYRAEKGAAWDEARYQKERFAHA